MSHRRKGRRPSLVPLCPSARDSLLAAAPMPRHLAARLRRAASRAALEALLDPRRLTHL